MDGSGECPVTFKAGVNNGAMIGENTGPVYINPGFHGTLPDLKAPDVNEYLACLGVDPEELRGNALNSTSDRPIKSCWDWVLRNPEFKAWIKSTEAPLLWIFGGPGKGKTVMALGLPYELHQEEVLDQAQALVLHFFCKNHDNRANTALMVLKGLIYSLVQKQVDLLRFLQQKYRSPTNVKGANMIGLWNVFRQMATNLTGFRSIYIIVDAVDECRNGSQAQRQKELHGLLELVRKDVFEANIKWLFTSRPSSDLRSVIGPGPKRYCIDLDKQEEPSQGVKTFIEDVVENTLQWKDASKEKVKTFLLSNAGSTFLYVSLVWKMLRTASDAEVADRLKKFENNILPGDIYPVYRIMRDQLEDNAKKQGTTLLQELLAVVLLASRPLSLRELGIVTGTSEMIQKHEEGSDHCRLTEMIQQCGHFLQVVKGTVYIVHKSAEDYLKLGEETPTSPFLSSIHFINHAIISERCLKWLISSLRRPAFDTPESLMDQNLQPESIDELKSHAYVYAHWTDHVIHAGYRRNLRLLLEFFENRFLAWVEAMATLRQLRHCIHVVKSLITVMTEQKCAKPPESTGKLHDLIGDYARFLHEYQFIIQSHPSQVYFLALYFTPKDSLTRKNSGNQASCCLKITLGPSGDSDPCLYTLDLSQHSWGEKDLSKARKPRYNRRGFNILELVGRFSYTSRDFRLSFSEDSRFISASSNTLGRKVLRWSIQDGDFVCPAEVPKACIAISRDGRFIASLEEHGIKISDFKTRSSSRRYLGHCGGKITEACFSRDGTRLAVAFEEPSTLFRPYSCQLLIWSMQEDCLPSRIDLSSDGQVQQIVFSDRPHIVAVKLSRGSLLWNTDSSSRHELQNPVAANQHSMIFSADAKILTVITESSVTFYRVDPFDVIARWPVPRNNCEIDEWFRRSQTWSRPKPNLGMETAISPDGRIAAISYGESIALFNLYQRELPPKYHITTKFRIPVKNANFFFSKLPMVDSLLFSPCGKYLVCARNDDLVSVWDVEALARAPSRSSFHDGAGELWCEVPIISADGKVCGFRNGSRLCLCEVSTGVTKIRVQGTPKRFAGDEGKDSYTTSVSDFDYLPWTFSPDSRLAVTVVAGKLTVVNTNDWKHHCLNIDGHIHALSFNPQSTKIAISTETDGGQARIQVYDCKVNTWICEYTTMRAAFTALTFTAQDDLIAAGRRRPTYESRPITYSTELSYAIWAKPASPAGLYSRNPRMGSVLIGADWIGPPWRCLDIATSPDELMASATITLPLGSGSEGSFMPYKSTRKVKLGFVYFPLHGIRSLHFQPPLHQQDSTGNESLLTNHCDITINSRGEYALSTSLWHRRDCADDQLCLVPSIAVNWGQRRPHVTTYGKQLPRPPERRCDTSGRLGMVRNAESQWITWDGHMIAYFPIPTLKAEHDHWREYLVLSLESGGSALVSIAG